MDDSAPAKPRAHHRRLRRTSSESLKDKDQEDAHNAATHADAAAFAVAAELNANQKNALAGACACLLVHVTDGSPRHAWSEQYLLLVVERFLGLNVEQGQALMPMLEARAYGAEENKTEAEAETKAKTETKTETKAKTKTKAGKDHADREVLDPSPFLLHVVPASKEGRLRAWLGFHSKRTDGAKTTSPTMTLGSDEIDAFRIELVKKLLWFTVKSIGYDARVRVLLRAMVKAMRLSWQDVTAEEVRIGQALFAEATSMPTSRATAKRSLWDWKRNLTIGAAAVTGGALLAVTGGLAAPAIAASLTALGGAGAVIGTALGSAAGVTATTVLFGTAGAGVVGMKTDTRTRGVQEFQFDLVSSGEGMNVYICVSGWLDEDDPRDKGFRKAWGDSREYLRAFYRRVNPSKVDQVEQVLERYKGREDEFFGILRKTYGIRQGTKDYDPLGMQEHSFAAMNHGGSDVAELELMRAWRWKDRMRQGDQYCLQWEEKLLRRFAESMKTFASQQVMTYANQELVKLTAFAALFAAVAIPRTLFSAANMIDNVWTLMANHADQSGKLLADSLQRREQGLRPVTLIGYGFGARLLFSCLQRLCAIGTCDGIVENVVLLGMPVAFSKEQWTNARKVVAGRVINGYSENDWMLAIMYRYQGWALNSAGIGPIHLGGIENVNLSSVIKGHLEYKLKMGAILDLLGLEA